VDLYKTVGAGEGVAGQNTFVSPFSVSSALAMTYAGARGPGEKPFALRVTNAVWGQKGFAFEQPFLDTLATSYDPGIDVTDFIGAPDASRTLINRWVESQTEDRIRELLPVGIIEPVTRMVLVDAIYFNAGWATTFDRAATADAPFHTLDGTTTSAPTMHPTLNAPYRATDSYEAIELPYDGGETSMLVIAPKAGTFASFEKGTEAAAATAVVVVGETSAAPVGTSMKVDRPYLAAIVDRPTKSILFLGRIVNPAQK